MAKLAQETKDKISEAIKRCLQSPTYRQRRSEGLKRSWTPARRAAVSRERREFWRKWREAKARKEAGDATQG
jgi:hypothetical protein